MKHLFHAFALSAGLALAAIPAAADPPGGTSAQQDVVERLKPADVVDFLQREGYRAETADIGGSTYVRFKIAGVTAFVEFYGCETAGCSSFRFLITNKVDRIDINFTNEWNYKYRYSKMYIDKKGNFWLDVDVRLAGGLAVANLRGYLQIFEDAINTLRK